MKSRPASRGSWFRILIGLTVLSFTTISAGIGLMQTFYSGTSTWSSNTSTLPQEERSLIFKQVNILFPIGQLLLIVGLSIILSILVQMLFIAFRVFRTIPLWAKIIMTIATAGPVIYAVWPPHYETIVTLLSDFEVHYDFWGILFLLTSWLTVGLFSERKRISDLSPSLDAQG